MKFIKIVSILLTIIFITSCATIFGDKTQNMPINSEPSGATVYLNGKKMGKTPLMIELTKNKENRLRFVKDGYETLIHVPKTSPGGKWLALDIISIFVPLTGGIIPIIVDAATGNWVEFKDSEVNVILRKE